VTGAAAMQPRTVSAVEDVILVSFLDHQKPLSVREIRDECKLSATIIRKVVNESHKITRTQKEVLIYSRDYPTMIHQRRSVDAFYPTRKWLAELLKQERRELHYIKTERKWNG